MSVFDSQVWLIYPNHYLQLSCVSRPTTANGLTDSAQFPSLPPFHNCALILASEHWTISNSRLDANYRFPAASVVFPHFRYFLVRFWIFSTIFKSPVLGYSAIDMDSKVYVGGLPNDATSQEVCLAEASRGGMIVCFSWKTSSTVSAAFARCGSPAARPDSLSSNSRTVAMRKTRSRWVQMKRRQTIVVDWANDCCRPWTDRESAECVRESSWATAEDAMAAVVVEEEAAADIPQAADTGADGECRAIIADMTQTDDTPLGSWYA